MVPSSLASGGIDFEDFFFFLNAEDDVGILESETKYSVGKDTSVFGGAERSDNA